MTESATRPKTAITLVLWLCASVVGANLVTLQPAKADYYNHHRNERHHANPYRDNDGSNYGYGYRHNWHHHHRYEPRCTNRAVPYWDSFWGQWRTNYVRECW